MGQIRQLDHWNWFSPTIGLNKTGRSLQPAWPNNTVRSFELVGSNETVGPSPIVWPNKIFGSFELVGANEMVRSFMLVSLVGQ